MNGLPMLVRTEAKLVARDTTGLIIPFGLPLLILIMNGIGVDAPGQAAIPRADSDSMGIAVIVPISLALVIGMIALINMPSFLASYRTTGALRRLSVTPAHPVTVLVAQVLVSLGQCAVGIVLALGVATIAFDLGMPANLAGVLLTVAVATAALYALGMLVAAVAPTTNAAIAMGLVAFFAMMALGGAFGPVENLPAPLPAIGEHTPFGAAVHGMAASWAGGTPEVGHLAAMAITALVAGAAAARLFRWD